MDRYILFIFLATYAGMAAGRVPGLKLDRAGIALIAVAALLAGRSTSVAAMAGAIDLPTLLLLFALMIVSAQFGNAGFYRWVAFRLAAAPVSGRKLILFTILVAGGLSAILANDVIAFAFAPILAEGARRRGLDPRPLLIALAGACNAGSAMTVIGNPQNILIGQAGHLDFWAFLLAAAPPGLFALVVVYVAVARFWREALDAAPSPMEDATPPSFDRRQTIKGLGAVLLLAALFETDLPRDVGALVIAAFLLMSRKVPSRGMLAAVDWHLLMLFACLFTVTETFAATPIAADGVAWLTRHGVFPSSVLAMTPVLGGLSNVIGNVPAVMLLLSVWHQPPEGALYGMAILSTLAGNLFIGGSLANIIVAERARLAGVRLSFLDHARTGVPVTLVSMAGAGVWLAVTGYMPLR